MLGVIVSLGAGCQQLQRLTPDVADATAAYERRDYETAFSKGAAVARSGRDAEQTLGAYIAGMSARRMGDTANAARYLSRALNAEDESLAADAAATLGILYSEEGRYADAAHALLRAADLYTGENRARAYFHAGIAQQKLGRWAQARTSLILARAASRNPEFWQQVEQQLNVTGYTIQTGAFRDSENAQRAAADLVERAAAAGLPEPRLVRSVDAAAGEVTLVQVGEFATFASARSSRDRIGADGAVIVPLASD
ncbi:MAG: SPOR domain-containing protein [Phycisphaeraceae bacterium]